MNASSPAVIVDTLYSMRASRLNGRKRPGLCGAITDTKDATKPTGAVSLEVVEWWEGTGVAPFTEKSSAGMVCTTGGRLAWVCGQDIPARLYKTACNISLCHRTQAMFDALVMCQARTKKI